MLTISGNYSLRVEVGSQGDDVTEDIVFDPNTFDTFTVTQYIDRLLPSFRIKFTDPMNILTQLMPSDRRISNYRITFGRGTDLGQYNIFDMVTYRRFPTSEENYEVEGLLALPTVFSVEQRRGFSGNISDVIDTIRDELLLDSSEISSCLNHKTNIIQPDWTNMDLLYYLQNNVVGQAGESCFFTFIKCLQGEKILVFRSLPDLVSQDVRYRFYSGDQPLAGEDFIPIMKYSIVDNSRVLSTLGGKIQSYSYFNYKEGRLVEETEDISNYPKNLAQYFLIEKDDEGSSYAIRDLGRNNDFNLDFRGTVVGHYHRRLTNLNSMWITIWGEQNICPGDLVEVYFPEYALQGRNIQSQYSGRWLVNRVVHSFGMSYFSKLLLTRNGIDTFVETTLLSGDIE